MSYIIILFIQTSSKDTLLVMMQICVRNKNSIPFIAQGPNNQILREARAISELSIAIKKAVTSDCPGLECVNRSRRDTSIISSMPIEIFSQELSPQKRSSRDKVVPEKATLVRCINYIVFILINDNDIMTRLLFAYYANDSVHKQLLLNVTNLFISKLR